MKHFSIIFLLACCLVSGQKFKTLDDRYSVTPYPSLEVWKQRAAYLREHILASTGLLPMPEKTALRPAIFGEQKHPDYSVFKVYFESLPGFLVTGNLYRPVGAGPFPAILSPHGHWTYGRLENTQLASVPGRAINLARQGFVVFTYDMVGYNDSRQLEHRRFGGKRENLWGLSVSGLQLWNSIRVLDFLESLPEVDRSRIGCTGASGGGTQTFLLAAVDERVKVAAPVNMISLHMQGGCICENPPGLRLNANNVEIAACIAPRPLLMVSATGDWTKETMQLEYPEMRKIYSLFGADSHVYAVQMQADHNYNRDSREAVYAWMARWLQNAPAEVKIKEKSFQPEPLSSALVFYGRALPEQLVTASQLTDYWIAAAKKQLQTADRSSIQSALRHALSLEETAAVTPGFRSDGQNRKPPAGKPKPIVVLAAESERDPLEEVFQKSGFSVQRVRFTPFDAEAATKISHFETYNRTSASQQVYDIVQALKQTRSSSTAPVVLVARPDAALAALLAQAFAPVDQVILDVGQFDNGDDAAMVERFYIPGIRRAGDFQTALSMSVSHITIHNAGEQFKLQGVRLEKRKLSDQEIATALR